MAPQRRTAGLHKAAAAPGQQTLSFWVRRAGSSTHQDPITAATDAAPQEADLRPATKNDEDSNAALPGSPQAKQTMPEDKVTDTVTHEEPFEPLRSSSNQEHVGAEPVTSEANPGREDEDQTNADCKPSPVKSPAQSPEPEQSGSRAEAPEESTYRDQDATGPSLGSSVRSRKRATAEPVTPRPAKATRRGKAKAQTPLAGSNEDEEEKAAATATAAFVPTLRQRLAARGSPAPPPTGRAKVAAKERLSEAVWPPPAKSPSDEKEGATTSSGLPFHSPEEKASPCGHGERVATPCRKGQRRPSMIQVEEAADCDEEAFGQQFATPPPSLRQGNADCTPTPPHSQHSAAGEISSPSKRRFLEAHRPAPRSPNCDVQAGFQQQSEGTLPAAADETPSSGQSSVRELKAMLAKHDVDFSSCVEKAELQNLWNRFSELCQRPLAELQDMCVRAGIAPSSSLQKASDFAKLLVMPCQQATKVETASSVQTTMPVSNLARATSSTFSLGSDDQTDSAAGVRKMREAEAAKEIARILPLRREAYSSHAVWARAVLGLSRSTAAPFSLDVGGVQQAFRSIMRKLHPDRIGISEGAAHAMEMLREARQICERSLSQLQPPRAPRNLTSTTLCDVPGRRRIKLEWSPPEWCEDGPIRRYLVAALDPSYGRALTITILEPDYSEELGRFVPVEEIGSFILAEEELRKMPSLFRQAVATVQVAAANEAGQSPWATLRISLREAAAVPAGASSSSNANDARVRGRNSGSGTETASGTVFSMSQCTEFEVSARALTGASLMIWLRRQNKALLSAWLKLKSLPVLGSKEELVERVAWAIGDSKTAM